MKGSNHRTSGACATQHPLEGVDPDLATPAAVELNESHRLDRKVPKFAEGGIGLPPVYADEDTIFGVEVSKGPAAAAHTHLERVVITASDKGFSGSNKIQDGS